MCHQHKKRAQNVSFKREYGLREEKYNYDQQDKR